MRQNILVFDFDGTIADSMAAARKIFKQLAKDFHFGQPDLDNFEVYQRQGAKQAVKTLKIPVDKLPAIMDTYRLESSKAIELLKPVKGIKRVLLKLEKSGFTLGILTSNSTSNVKKFLHNNHLDIFEFIYSLGGLFHKDKLMKKMLTNLNLTSSDVIYIGDETRDIEAAKKMKIKVAAVAWGYNSANVLKKQKPDYLFCNPKDLTKLLEFCSATSQSQKP